MAEPKRFLLARETCRAGSWQILIEIIENLVLLALEQRHFEFELAIEMVLDDALVATGHENEMLDSSLAGFIHDMLDQRPVDDRQHLFRHGLGRGQEARAEPGYRKNGLTDGFHANAMACGRTIRVRFSK